MFRIKRGCLLQQDNNPKQGKSSKVNRNSFAMTLTGSRTDLKKALSYNRYVKNNGQTVAKQSSKIKTDMSRGMWYGRAKCGVQKLSKGYKKGWKELSRLLENIYVRFRKGDASFRIYITFKILTYTISSFLLEEKKIPITKFS